MIKIAVIGPESTGKTWLVKKLSRHYNGYMVSEYSREYFNNRKYVYDMDDLVEIAKGQINNQKLLPANEGIAFCDTELLTIAIWSQIVFKTIPEYISKNIPKQEYKLYLLCNLDVEWKPDRFRRNNHNRQEIYNMFVSELNKYGFEYRIISGTDEKRLLNSINVIDSFINER